MLYNAIEKNKDKIKRAKNTNRKAKLIGIRLTKAFNDEFFRYSKKLKLSLSDTVRRVLESELIIDRLKRDFQRDAKKELALNTKDYEALHNADIQHFNLLRKCEQAINEMNQFKEILINRCEDIVKLNNKYSKDLKNVERINEPIQKPA